MDALHAQPPQPGEGFGFRHAAEGRENETLRQTVALRPFGILLRRLQSFRNRREEALHLLRPDKALARRQTPARGNCIHQLVTSDRPYHPVESGILILHIHRIVVGQHSEAPEYGQAAQSREGLTVAQSNEQSCAAVPLQTIQHIGPPADYPQPRPTVRRQIGHRVVPGRQFALCIDVAAEDSVGPGETGRIQTEEAADILLAVIQGGAVQRFQPPVAGSCSKLYQSVKTVYIRNAHRPGSPGRSRLCHLLRRQNPAQQGIVSAAMNCCIRLRAFHNYLTYV